MFEVKIPTETIISDKKIKELFNNNVFVSLPNPLDIKQTSYNKLFNRYKSLEENIHPSFIILNYLFS